MVSQKEWNDLEARWPVAADQIHVARREKGAQDNIPPAVERLLVDLHKRISALEDGKEQQD